MELWKIKMKTTSAGPEKSMLAGKEYDVSQEEAKQLIPVYADLVWKPESSHKDLPETGANVPMPEIEPSKPDDKPEFPKSLSPGRWELSNGKIIQGKKVAAIEAENALKG